MPKHRCARDQQHRAQQHRRPRPNNGTIAIDADGSDASLTVNGDFTNNTTLTLTSSNAGANANLTVAAAQIFFNNSTIDVQVASGRTRTIRQRIRNAGRHHPGQWRCWTIGASFNWSGGSIAAGAGVRLMQVSAISGVTVTLDGALINTSQRRR